MKVITTHSGIPKFGPPPIEQFGNRNYALRVGAASAGLQVS